MEANYRASRAYGAKAWSGVLTCFQAAGALHRDPRVFWGEVATRGVEVHLVPGEGEDVFREPNVAVLAQRLRSCLENARRSPRGGL